MKLRHVAKTVGITAAVACAGGLSAVGFAGVAGAAPASGDTLPSAALPIGTFVPGPFSSGQTISVQVPANTVLPQHANIVILECAAPNGVDPTSTAACDANTISADSIQPTTDGSFVYNNYQLYALPNIGSLGESATGTPVCGNSAATECVLYIGNNYNDFTAPHFWSQPFKTVATVGDTGANPGDGTPEVPLALALPIAAAGLMAGGIVLRRRRHVSDAA